MFNFRSKVTKLIRNGNISISKQTKLLTLRSFSGNDRSLSRGESGGFSRMTSIQFMPSIADDPAELADSLADMQAHATRERVPWFQSAMPPSYFRQVPKDRRLQHLISVAAVPDLQDVPETVTRAYDDNGKVTNVSVISSGLGTVGQLENALDKVPDSCDLQGKKFCSCLFFRYKSLHFK